MIKKYRLWDNILGWTVFVVASVTYLMTIEPTMSLWDCSEFIATAFKLEVGHPPGAPFFHDTRKIFCQFRRRRCVKSSHDDQRHVRAGQRADDTVSLLEHHSSCPENLSEAGI